MRSSDGSAFSRTCSSSALPSRKFQPDIHEPGLGDATQHFHDFGPVGHEERDSLTPLDPQRQEMVRDAVGPVVERGITACAGTEDRWLVGVAYSVALKGEADVHVSVSAGSKTGRLSPT